MRIEDYAIIGDLKTAALVSKEGSIDWLCMPRFDAGACFASLIGNEDNGRWRIAPKGRFSVTRSYRTNTLVLDTVFETPEGAVKLTDCMIPALEVPTVLRRVEGLRGDVAMQMELLIRFDYGSITPWITRNPFGGLKAVAGPESLRLKTTVDLTVNVPRALSDFTVREGQTIPFVLTWAPSHLPAPSEIENPENSLELVCHWWRDWMRRCRYRGPYQDAVKRSLMTLKALTYDPTGGIVAAPTTSLPEELGGVRNWDYRYCWVRDSVLTLSALLSAGYHEEALRWRDWLQRSIAGNPSDVRIMYGLGGERRLPELELPWLCGYEGTGPVRIGNAAHHQHQLDIYGGLMESFHLSRTSGLEHDEFSWDVQRKLIQYVEEIWERPDRGIWEVRGPERHFTHSKAMAWVALDRAIRAAEFNGTEDELRRWKRLAARIHAEVCEKGFDPDLGSFTQSYGSKQLDASLLLLPLTGFLPCYDPRIVGTVAAIEKHLVRDGFVMRYSTEDAVEDIDGIPGNEGAFLACSFWLADNYFIMGRLRESVELFERILNVRNDVGLLAEEYDPKRKRLLGNFPQAFSHLALLNTAFLYEAKKPTLESRGRGLKAA